jgi:hypothetical protein
MHLKLSRVYCTLLIRYTYQTGGKIFHPKQTESCLWHLPFVSFLVCTVSDRIQPCPGHQMPKQPIVFPSIKKKEISVKKLVLWLDDILPICWMGTRRNMYGILIKMVVLKSVPVPLGGWCLTFWDIIASYSGDDKSTKMFRLWKIRPPQLYCCKSLKNSHNVRIFRLMFEKSVVRMEVR